VQQGDPNRHGALLKDPPLNRATVLIFESVQSYAFSDNCVWSDEGSKSHCEAVETI
jgi:hypothetical protein